MTPPDLTRWMLRTPARFALTVAVIVLLLLAGYLALHQPGSASRAETTSTGEATTAPDTRELDPTAVGSMSASPSPEGAEQSTLPRRRATRLARGFLGDYLAPGPDLPALRGLATPALWQGLRLTDPAALPRGPLKALHVTRAGAYTADVRARLASDTLLRLRLVAQPAGLRVADIRPVPDR